MITFLAIFFSSLIVAFSGAMMPGPLLTVTISESTTRGSIAGPLLISGHAILELILVTCLIFGLAPLFGNLYFFIIIAFLGGLIMIWMAYGMFKSIPTLTVSNSETTEKKKNLFLAGALMSLANPYWIIWWATIGLGYIVSSMEYGFFGVALFFIGHITGDMIWYFTISFAIGKGKKLFTDKTYKILIAVCGTFLTGYAFYLVASGLNRII